MSLQQVVNEQMAIREQIVAMQEKLLQNDQIIAQLRGMPPPGRPKGAPGRGQAFAQLAAQSTYSAPPPAVYSAAPGSPGGFGKPQSAGFSLTAPRPGAAPRPAPAVEGPKARLSPGALEKMNDELPDADAWEQPKDAKKSPATIDRTEQLLRTAFNQYQETKPTRRANPVGALQNLLRSLDTNHSGKIDFTEFKKLCEVLQFSAQDAMLEGVFKRYDLDNSGKIDQEEFGRLLMKPDGDSNAKAKSAVARMREVLAYRAGGFPHMKAMGSQFRIVDRDHNNKLDKDEFNIALDSFFSYYKIKFTPAEKKALFDFFDKHGEGTIDYDEYIRAVRGDMNEFRLGWVRQAFSILDTDGSGIVSTDEMMAKYDVSQSPDVKSGKASPVQAIRTFMETYDANKDGQITEAEFVENYNWVSASVDSDDYFELMMRNAWHISGGEGWCANTSNLRVLVIHTDGTQEVVGINSDLGLNKNDNAAVLAALTKQGVKNIKKIQLSG